MFVPVATQTGDNIANVFATETNHKKAKVLSANAVEGIDIDSTHGTYNLGVTDKKLTKITFKSSNGTTFGSIVKDGESGYSELMVEGFYDASLPIPSTVPVAGSKFSHWATDENGLTAVVPGENGRFGSVDITYWAVWERIEYSVTYVVNGDATYGKPADSVTPTDNTGYGYGDAVTVADTLTSTQTYAEVNGKQIPGTWGFSGWNKDDFIITEDTTITGSWMFTPDPPVTYGNLTISKTVTGDMGDKTKYFYFTVTFDADGSYNYSGSKSGTISSGGIIQLKHGESVTIVGLPTGTKYSVTESGYSGYKVYASGDTGVIQENTTSIASFKNFRSKVPITGDTTNLSLWFAFMALSICGLIVVTCARKKKHSNR